MSKVMRKLRCKGKGWSTGKHLEHVQALTSLKKPGARHARVMKEHMFIRMRSEEFLKESKIQ